MLVIDFKIKDKGYENFKEKGRVKREILLVSQE